MPEIRVKTRVGCGRMARERFKSSQNSLQMYKFVGIRRVGIKIPADRVNKETDGVDYKQSKPSVFLYPKIWATLSNHNPYF